MHRRVGPSINERCQYFPNCPAGDTCPLIHPGLNYPGKTWNTKHSSSQDERRAHKRGLPSRSPDRQVRSEREVYQKTYPEQRGGKKKYPEYEEPEHKRAYPDQKLGSKKYFDYSEREASHRRTYPEERRETKKKSPEYSDEEPEPRKRKPDDKPSPKHQDERESHKRAPPDQKLEGSPIHKRAKVYHPEPNDGAQPGKPPAIPYAECPDAEVPDLMWRLYVIKDGIPQEYVRIHKKSAYSLGRDRDQNDIPLDNPSCSKHHAVIQFRTSLESGAQVIRPFLFDLGSTNGVNLNGKRVPPRQYQKLVEGDVLKFGDSSRVFVLLHEQSDL